MRDFLIRLDSALVRRPVPVMCFATSAVALAAAALGSLINYALAEYMAVGGMLMVSLFFLGLGLLHRNEVVKPSKSEAEAPQSFAVHRRAPRHKSQLRPTETANIAFDEGLDGTREVAVRESVGTEVG